MIKIDNFNKIIAANWKLNTSKEFINDYFKKLNSISIDHKTCVIICAPTIYLSHCSSLSTKMYLGAQNCSNFNEGAYTGEISAYMLKDNNCNFCIVGHSERRKIFKETNDDINYKVKNLLKVGINPIICIGETLEDKNSGRTFEVLLEQVKNALNGISMNNSIVLAYEPIWSIGTGFIPSLQEISDIHAFLKKEIKKFKTNKIIYGGSVKSDNAAQIMKIENVDGVLIGGASLDISDFIKILQS